MLLQRIRFPLLAILASYTLNRRSAQVAKKSIIGNQIAETYIWNYILLQKTIVSKTIGIITETSVVEITIIKRKIEKNSNSKRIKTSSSSSSTRTRIRIATTKSKRLLKQ